MPSRGFGLPVAAVGLVLAVCGSAGADQATLPAWAPQPWSDPNHRTPLELRLSAVASRLAGHPASVRCFDWAGYLRIEHANRVPAHLPGGLYVVAFVPGRSRRLVDLSPPVCDVLQAYAQANPKRSTPRTRSDVTGSVVAVAHETVHLDGVADEGLAECVGMVRAPAVAVALGATPAEGRALALAYYHTTFAAMRRRDPTYWRAGCNPAATREARRTNP